MTYGDTPPPVYECNPAAECGSSVGCECLMGVCAEPEYQCSGTTEPGQFRCEIIEA